MHVFDNVIVYVELLYTELSNGVGIIEYAIPK